MTTWYGDHSMGLGNDTKINMEEDSENRIVKYYQNDIIKQVAILQKETGDIYYYDMTQCNVAVGSDSVDGYYDRIYMQSSIYL